jgi:tubulin-like protein CetZ
MRTYKMAEDNTSVKEISKKSKDKTQEDVEKDNQELMAAFGGKEEKPGLDPSVLAKLKKKSQEKSKGMEVDMPDLISEQEVSINIAVVGVGQAGSRVAEEFHNLGYDVGVVNTSAQDLKFIDVLPHQKLLLEGSLGGTGKDLDLGREIFSDNEDAVVDFVNKVVDGNDMVFLAVSGGGGTGSSSVDTMIPMLYSTGIPVGVIYVLPKATEDARSKRNAIETLARLARMTADDMVSSLVVVDNARIEQIYGGLSQSQFWNTANHAIVEPLHLFNNLTAQASKFTSMDPSDFGKVISCGDCSVYGVVEVEDYMEETALAEAVMNSLNSNMLAEGFDLNQTRVGGVIIVGSEEALNRLPAINIDYCFHVISEETNGASIYQGIYSRDDVGDGVKIYSWFAGLGLPQDRIDNLRKESRAQAAVAAAKEGQRTASMTLDLEEDKVTSRTDEIHRKIQKKKSGFNRLQGGARKSIIDKRRR